MKLVVDSSIVFCGLIGAGVTKEIIFLENVKLFSVEYFFDEFEEHKQRVVSLSGLSPDDFNSLFELLKKRIDIIPKGSFDKFLKEANTLISDKDDTEYLALAMASNIPIWSNDRHFKQQSMVKVFTTEELAEYLKLKGHKFL